MKKSLSTIFLALFLANNCFALSPEYRKEILDGCYLDAKNSLGSERAKQYCTCTTKMLHKKFTDEELLKVLNMKSQSEQIEILSFAANYCNRNANAPD